MAESINDIAIKLSVDAAGVSKGFRTAAEEARSYKAELDRLVYAVGRSEPVDYNAHVTQYTQATNERLAKEKKAQEEFNAWYRGEADREFQAWYAVKLKKEQVREQQLADERQRAINTSNAQNSQRQLPAETAARGDENAALREAITQRFALRDEEDRAIAANVANRDAAHRRAVADAAKAQQQELADLRQAITQRYALRDQEERQEQLYAANMANIARMQAERTQRAAAAADAQRDSDFAKYKADLARQEAAGMINAERTARIERARQRDAKRAADDDRVRQLNDWRMQQAMMQRAAVDTQLKVGRAAGGFGGAAMAMGQASYAAEDFIQVLSMGGGLNMALMSASNNLSMVIRALLGTSAVMSAIAGIAVPAALIATGMFIRSLMEEEQQAESTAEALRKIRDAYDDMRDAARRASQQQRLLRDIQNTKDVESIENSRLQEQDKLNDLLKEQKVLEEELAAIVVVPVFVAASIALASNTVAVPVAATLTASFNAAPAAPATAVAVSLTLYTIALLKAAKVPASLAVAFPVAVTVPVTKFNTAFELPATANAVSERAAIVVVPVFVAASIAVACDTVAVPVASTLTASFNAAPNTPTTAVVVSLTLYTIAFVKAEITPA